MAAKHYTVKLAIGKSGSIKVLKINRAERLDQYCIALNPVSKKEFSRLAKIINR